MKPGSLNILVIEDHPDTAASTKTLLELHGYSVQVAADGPSGIDSIESRWPDVVLLDIGLPGMSGYEVAAAIRALNRQPRPVLIAVSGYGTEGDRKQSYRSGIDLHLVKPVDPFELVSTIERLRLSLPSGKGRASS